MRARRNRADPRGQDLWSRLGPRGQDLWNRADLRGQDLWNRADLRGQDVLGAGTVLLLWPLTVAVLHQLGWFFVAPVHLLFAVLVPAVALHRARPRTVLLLGAVAYPVLYVAGIAALRRGYTSLVYSPPLVYLFPLWLAAHASGTGGRPRARRAVAVLLGGTFVIGLPWSAVLGALTAPTSCPADGRACVDWTLVVLDALAVSDVGLAGGLTLTVYLLGRAAYRQRRAAELLAARNIELERLRRVEAEQVVAQERARIARELHDVVAHHVSAMVIRAQAADRVAERQPEEMRASVRWIALTGQEALAAMRKIVRVLRSQDGTPAGELSPGRCLADLEGIVERVQAAGLPVELDVPGTLPPLTPPVELAAVRIVQESLTNALVHAGGTRALVRVWVDDTRLLLQVDDDGVHGPPPQTAPGAVPEATREGTRPAGATETTRPLPSPGAGAGPAVSTRTHRGLRVGRAQRPPRAGGHGLGGMRERATSCGGTFELVVGDLGGWCVRAALPLVETPSAGEETASRVPGNGEASRWEICAP